MITGPTGSALSPRSPVDGTDLGRVRRYVPVRVSLDSGFGVSEAPLPVVSLV